ncbi:hypothetical protein [Devosia sp. A369]
MRIGRWLLYGLAVAMALVGIYIFTLGGYFVFVGVGLYGACWLVAWLAGKIQPMPVVTSVGSKTGFGGFRTRSCKVGSALVEQHLLRVLVLGQIS